jgi:hypothetical protein
MHGSSTAAVSDTVSDTWHVHKRRQLVAVRARSAAAKPVWIAVSV